MLANIFTKPLLRTTFGKLRKRISLKILLVVLIQINKLTELFLSTTNVIFNNYILLLLL